MRLKYFACLLALVLMPVSVSAHAVGAFWTAQDGEYTADVGYDPATFTAGEYTRFDFLLWRGPADTGELTDFAQVWVRILAVNEKNTVLATGIWKQPIGPTTLLYEFQKAGKYTIETSYRDVQGNDIAVASFPVDVAAADSSMFASLMPLLALCIGIGIGAAAAILFGRRRM